MLKCEVCGRELKTKAGRSIRTRSQHPDHYHTTTNPRIKAQWNKEEIYLLATAEAQTTLKKVCFMNQELTAIFQYRTLKSIKGMRRKPDYKDQVKTIVDALKAKIDAGTALHLTSHADADRSLHLTSTIQTKDEAVVPRPDEGEALHQTSDDVIPTQGSDAGGALHQTSEERMSTQRSDIGEAIYQKSLDDEEDAGHSSHPLPHVVNDPSPPPPHPLPQPVPDPSPPGPTLTPDPQYSRILWHKALKRNINTESLALNIDEIRPGNPDAT